MPSPRFESNAETSPGAACLSRHRHDHLVVDWPDGARDVLHAVWLRDNCGCEECRHPGSGQRLLDADSVPDEPRLSQAEMHADGSLVVHFEPDGHRSTFAADWLRANSAAIARPRPRTLWAGGSEQAAVRIDYEAVCNDAAALRDWLAQVQEFGFALLSGVPCESAQVETVAKLFGQVHETNYGRHFDVRSVAEPSNLAYTGQGLSVHTDNPYRDPAPTLQLLHCLRNDASGGDTLLVDGFAAAERLRETAPHDFALLTRWRVPFRFESREAVLQSRVHVIETDDREDLRAVRYNNRSVAAFDLPADVLPAYYRAYRKFARRLGDDEASLHLRLEPGDLLLMDNRRVLHGRTAFAASGERWLQGCYAGVDALLSRLDLLTRTNEHGAAPNAK